MKKLIKILLSTLAIYIIISNIGTILASQKEKYLSHNYWQRFPALEKTFRGSQYVSKHPTGWIVDEAAFSYAGGKLIKGTNPVLVLIDAPPLGKYLIGLSALMFNNENIFTALFGILSLCMLYVVSQQILKNNLLAFLPPLFYSFELIFKNQFIYTPLLDVFQLFFLLSYFYFINRAFFAKKWTILFFIIANIFLGCFISTKFFISGSTIIAASLLWTLLHKNRKKTLQIILTLPIAIVVLLLNYIRVFAFGYSLHQFLGIQKYILLYHKSQIILPFSVWPLLLMNRWYVWFGNKPIISDPQWSITWPIITILSLITMLFYLLKKIPHRPEIEIIMLWSVCYLLFLSSGQIFSRYLIILLPIFYIITVYGATQVLILLQKTKAHPITEEKLIPLKNAKLKSQKSKRQIKKKIS